MADQVNQSHWQRGCEDAKAGRPRTLPSDGGRYDRANTGYLNGYDYGHSTYRMPVIGAAIVKRALRDDDRCPECFKEAR